MNSEALSSSSASGQNDRYHGVAQLLHWLMALMIITMVVIGLFHEGWTDEVKGVTMRLHKSLGITVFALVLIRLGWRLTHKPPPYTPPLPAWQKTLATAVHWLFYALMIGLPIGGYLMSSGGSRPMLWFGVELPKVPIERESALWEMAHQGHSWGGYVMAGLIVLHITAAAYHLVSGFDNTVERMMPGGSSD
ncbi:cytochrome b [Alterisphingorhabdus coralli]|uniref:Cytochrome b n=1 Tax=Alterisphingorhabdus coralli TaxID=3071408 RepID=A0AA97F8V2_9SPHN|nr:cytochrome b [Parasphingorhabdus sp. SCSIO 66989]WOE75428.1 cytochrome b [Parasphingorhabdus sp. SCSIO 66989]